MHEASKKMAIAKTATALEAYALSSTGHLNAQGALFSISSTPVSEAG